MVPVVPAKSTKPQVAKPVVPVTRPGMGGAKKAAMVKGTATVKETPEERAKVLCFECFFGGKELGGGSNGFISCSRQGAGSGAYVMSAAMCRA